MQTATTSPALGRLLFCMHDKSPSWLGRVSREGAAAGLVTNFESDLPSAFYAHLYRHSGLPGGHVVMLGDDQASRCACCSVALWRMHVPVPTSQKLCQPHVIQLLFLGRPAAVKGQL